MPYSTTGLLITCDIFNMPNNKKNVSYFAHVSPHKKDILIIPVTVTLPPLPYHTSVISIGLANANAHTASDGFCTRTTTIPDINNIA